jgi:hypothetical protein
LQKSGDHILHRIYLFETLVLQKTEPSDAKVCMENIDHITWPICKTTQFRILSESAFASYTDTEIPT